MFENLGILHYELYFLGALGVILVPGPNSLFVVATSSSQGKGEAVKAAAAILLGDCLYICLSYFGFATVFELFPTAFAAVKLAGSVYLAWLGFQLIRAALSPGHATKRADAGALQKTVESTFCRALAVTLTNPKAIMFFAAFFIQFIEPGHDPAWLPYAILGLTLICINVTWLTVLVCVGAALSGLARSASWVTRVGNLLVGCLFVFFAVGLAL